jgi:D-serine deaminase-like pyridoxal phosphate-dependent protein
MMQVLVGASTEDQIACRLATRVIGHYPHDKRMCTDCGFTALTRQGLNAMPSGYVRVQGEPNLK